MKSTVTNSAEITVLPILDIRTTVGNELPVSFGATVLRAAKGLPGRAIRVSKATVDRLLGKPYPKTARDYEGMRHLHDALQSLPFVNVVRVVPTGAVFPILALPDSITVAGTAFTAVAAAAYSTIDSVTAGSGNIFTVFPYDGDPSVNRSVAIENVTRVAGAWATDTVYPKGSIISLASGKIIVTAADYDTDGVVTAPTLSTIPAECAAYTKPALNRFTLVFRDKDEQGTEYVLERHIVGLDVTDVDGIGRTAYLPDVLERDSSCFRAAIHSTASMTDTSMYGSLLNSAKTTFTGGDNDDTTEILYAQWEAGWKVYQDEGIRADLMFMGGVKSDVADPSCYPKLIRYVAEIATIRHDSFFFDCDPTDDPTAAIGLIATLGIDNRQTQAYYCPLSADDKWFGGKTVWGASGAAAAACGVGDAILSGNVPGVHYAPAGINRAKLTRTGIKNIMAPGDIIDRDAFVDARINPVVMMPSGGAAIDDCLALHFDIGYTRFTWVNRIANYIDHRFVSGAAAVKFDPDGLTRLKLDRLMTKIFEDLVTSQALVTPRDPADGTDPFHYTIIQQEIDLWYVYWEFCPTGAARRIVGQPRLIR